MCVSGRLCSSKMHQWVNVYQQTFDRKWHRMTSGSHSLLQAIRALTGPLVSVNVRSPQGLFIDRVTLILSSHAMHVHELGQVSIPAELSLYE